jgi:hypothetical protein
VTIPTATSSPSEAGKPAAPTGTSDSQSAAPDAGRPRQDWVARLGICALFAVLLVLMSVATIYRYTVENLQADGVMQSVMSVQNVDLFFWGQNRFASVVPFLASPFADPGVNLFVCLLINALCFHGLLLIVAWMGVHLVSGSRGWLPTLILFLVLVAVAHVVIVPGQIHIMALETQPYSMSWLLALGAYLLWKRREWWAFLLAVAMAGVCVGLNPSVVLIAAFLSVIEWLRRRQWIRWVVFGAVWLAWLGIWTLMSSRFGGQPSPNPSPDPVYFAFGREQFVADISRSTNSVITAFSPTRTVVLIAVACGATLLIARPLRAALLSRLALAILFAVGYFTLFAGNPWVASNAYSVRYFFPVLLTVVVCIAAGITGALLSIRVPAKAGLRQPLIAGATALACVASMAGPLTPPSQAPVLTEVQATADFARENGIHFVSGSYWVMAPLLHRLLVDGRDAAFMAGFKSGGDPAAYQARFEADLASGSPARALCVEDSVENCQLYLDFWTAPGWSEVPGELCPVPGPSPAFGSPPERVCRILENTGSGGS